MRGDFNMGEDGIKAPKLQRSCDIQYLDVCGHVQVKLRDFLIC